ncbi:hypothetical protein Q8A67_022009 [Cirrhinus molitorella]|uniref:Uncharacterized protein n=1 Tax=Cirrhinus molitorella TaxID=172907 RepID=A0AA88TF00_9TELE|nr:hypothetical protein Q8A67_022009 [Cirrhinus molitorella]
MQDAGKSMQAYRLKQQLLQPPSRSIGSCQVSKTTWAAESPQGERHAAQVDRASMIGPWRPPVALNPLVS